MAGGKGEGGHQDDVHNGERLQRSSEWVEEFCEKYKIRGTANWCFPHPNYISHSVVKALSMQAAIAFA